MARKIAQSFPDRVPIIVERLPKSMLPQIDKTKFLVHSDMQVGKFYHEVRKHIPLDPEQALFLFVGRNRLASPSDQVCWVHEQHREEDGFLYIKYCGENAFGEQ